MYINEGFVYDVSLLRVQQACNTQHIDLCRFFDIVAFFSDFRATLDDNDCVTCTTFAQGIAYGTHSEQR